ASRVSHCRAARCSAAPGNRIVTLGLASSRSSARRAGSMPARNSVKRWVSAITRFVVISGTRCVSASRKRRSASAWCWSRWLRSAIHAPLSTNSRAGAATRAIRCRWLGNERLIEIAVEARAEVGGETIDVDTQLEQRVLGGRTRQCPDGDTDRLRLRPAAFLSPRFEPLEVALIQVDLQGSSRTRHDHQLYIIMIETSMAS